MSIIADIFIWLLIDTAFGFLFYATGCFLLKVLTFGRYEMEFKDFVSFKDAKSSKVYAIMALGVSFYVIIIALIAYSNS